MASAPRLNSEKRRWWLSNRKLVDKYIKDARSLISTQEPGDVTAALALLDSALALSPRLDAAMELKARSLLFLRRFREVADMLQDYIPSYKIVPDDDASTSLNSCDPSKERAKLLPPNEEKADDGDRTFRCFSVSDLKNKVMAGLSWSCNEGHWRYLILGQACCHLGLMEDAMVLLQTGRRISTAAFRRESASRSGDSFAFSNTIQHNPNPNPQSRPASPPTESESTNHLISHIKLLLCRRTAALASFDAGLPSESIRHFSKILDGRRGTPHLFAAACLVGRAAAYKAAGRLAESIADCNLALALEPTSIPALRARADLMELVQAVPNCLRDLDHLKLLYDSILRDQKLPGPAWKPHYDVRYRDVPSNLRALTARIQELRRKVASGEGCNVDYYALIGVRRGCTRSELERAHLLLSLKHRPDRAAVFVERMEFADGYMELDAVRDHARMSALILYRMMQKGYSSIMSVVMDVEAATRAVAASAALQAVGDAVVLMPEKGDKSSSSSSNVSCSTPANKKAVAAAYQGVFCRDLAAVRSMMSQAGFNRPIPVKYEALSC